MSNAHNLWRTRLHERATYDLIVGNGTLCHYIIFTMWAAFTHKSDLSNGPQIHVDLNWTKLFEFDHHCFSSNKYTFICVLLWPICDYFKCFSHYLPLGTFSLGISMSLFEDLKTKFVFFLSIEICFYHQCSYFNKWWTSLSLYSTSLKLSIILKFSPSFTYCSDFIHSFFFHFPWSICWFVYTSQSPPISQFVLLPFDRLCERVLVTPLPSLFPITFTV